MNTPDRPRDTPNEFMATASNMSDRARLLAMAEERLPNRPAVSD